MTRGRHRNPAAPRPSARHVPIEVRFEIADLPRWTLRRHGTHIVDTGLLQGLYDGSFDGCPVNVQLEIAAHPSSQLACFRGSEATAECGITITFQPEGVTWCSKMCTGRRAVTVTRL